MFRSTSNERVSDREFGRETSFAISINRTVKLRLRLMLAFFYRIAQTATLSSQLALVYPSACVGYG